MMRKQWITAIKREDFCPSTLSRLCTNHFRPEDYITTGFETGKFIIKLIDICIMKQCFHLLFLSD